MVEAECGGHALDDAIDDSDDLAVAAITMAELRKAGLPDVALASGLG